MEGIPHIIHYFWFGGNEKPEIVLKCIASWKRYFPGWEIIEWNESNYDIHKCAYIKEAYEKKKWAFVSDYARFDILYRHGGIYFDTDVEVIRKLPKEFLSLKAFTGVEGGAQYIAPGLVFAIVKEHPYVKEILEVYENTRFVCDGQLNLKTVNERVTAIMQKKGYVINGEYQKIGDLCIYPAEYFCGYDLNIHEPAVTENTISVHHYAASWCKPAFRRKVSSYIKKRFGIGAYKKALIIKRFLFGSCLKSKDANL